MRWLSDLVVRRPWPFIVVFLVITALFATRLPSIQIDAEVKNQLPADMPARLQLKAIEERFGGSEMVLVVLEAPDVLDPAVLRRLHEIGAGLERIPQVDRVLSPFTLNRIAGSPDGMMAVEPAIDPADLPDDPAERAALAEALKANDLVFGNVVARDFSAISTIAMLSANAPDTETVAAVRQVVAAVPGPGTISIGGMPDVRVNVSEDIRSDMRRFVPIGLTIVVVFLYACFRQLRGVLLPFAPVVMSVVVAMGLLPILGWKLQMVMVTLPVILLAVANDYGIHLISRYQEENVPGKPRDAVHLTRLVMQDLGPPVIAAGVTTMAGLLCLSTHIVVPAVQLGFLAAVGVAFALLVSVLWVPAVLVLLPVPPPLPTLVAGARKGWLDRGLEAVARGVVGHPKAVVAAVLVTTVAASSGFFRLQVDTNPVNYYAADAPVAQTSRLVNQHFGGSTELSVMFEGDIQDPAVLGRIDHLQRALAAHPDVGFTSSIAGVVRMMDTAVSGQPREGLPDSREAVAQLFLLYSMGGDPEDFERMVDFEYTHALVSARISSLSTQRTSEVVQVARDAVAGQEGVTIGGFGVVFAELVDAVVQGQISSLALSLGAVATLVALTFRSVAGGLYATLPLVLAMPVLFGLMGWFGIELNVVTAMLSSIMVGVGVDYTLHFLWRYRTLRREGLSPEDGVLQTLTSAGRGIVFNALSVIVGFAVLLLSNFLPVQFFGFLVVVSISACLVGALVLLPALVLITRPAFLEP